jgi:hypothetical protein
MNTSGYGAPPYPAKVVDGKILVAISEFSRVPNRNDSICRNRIAKGFLFRAVSPGVAVRAE